MSLDKTIKFGRCKHWEVKVNEDMTYLLSVIFHFFLETDLYATDSHHSTERNSYIF